MDGVKMFPMLVYLVRVLKGHHDLNVVLIQHHYATR